MTTVMSGGDGERTSYRKTSRADDGRNHSCSGSAHVNFSAKLMDEEPMRSFKKPRLDVALVRDTVGIHDDDTSASLRSGFAGKAMEEESTAGCVGECCTCGVVGFQAELFRCSKCGIRVQHTYCSNSYNPRKRWFIGLCNWCEVDVSAARATSLTPRQVAQGTASKRDSERHSPWNGANSSSGKHEKMNTVDCLLGAALRLPTVGFSVEDFLQVECRGPSSVKRRKPPSFDTVEKARRSGPSCDDAVKSSSKSLKLGGEKSSGSSLDTTAERSQSPSFMSGDSKALKLKTPTSPARSVPPCALASDVKIEVSDGRMAEKSVSSSPLGACDEKLQSSFAGAIRLDRPRKSWASNNMAGGKSKCPKLSPKSSPRSIPGGSGGVPEGSEGSPDNRSAKLKRTGSFFLEKSETGPENRNASKPKRTDSFHANERSFEAGAAAPDSRAGSIRKDNNGSRDSPRSASGRESLRAGDVVVLSDQACKAENVEKTSNGRSGTSPGGRGVVKSLSGDQENCADDKSGRNQVAAVDSAAGGSDCSNITDQRNIKGCPSPKKAANSRQHQLRTQASMRQREQQQQRTSVSGKSPRANAHIAAAEERVQKKIFNQKDSNSKFRRTSSKISGMHGNFKSLSELLT